MKFWRITTLHDQLTDVSTPHVTADLAAASIETADIKDLNVTTAKIAALNVTAAKLAANAVETAKILDANVTTAKIADDAITDAKLGILTTKGDVLSYSTLPARLAVGTNDQVLTADSAQTTGLKWAAAGGGAGFWTVISDQTLGSNASTIAITSISDTYRYFKMLLIAKTTHTGYDPTRLQYNADTTDGNYYGLQIYGEGGGATTPVSYGATAPYITYVSNNIFSQTIAHITKLASQKPNAIAVATTLDGTNTFTSFCGTYWNNTAAISTITIDMTNGDFVAGSRLILLGKA